MPQQAPRLQRLEELGRHEQSFVGVGDAPLATALRDVLRDALQHDRRGRQTIDERTYRGPFEPSRRRGPERVRELEVEPHRIAEIERGAGGPSRILERRDHDLRHLVDLDDVHEGGARARDGAFEIHAFPKRPVDVGPHLVAERLEEGQHTDRGQGRVQIHRLKAADELGEDVKDAGERERDGRGHHRAAEHLVQIEQPLADERLRQHVEEHDAEHRADRRERRAHEPQEVREAEQRRRRADDHQEPDASLRGARSTAVEPRSQRDHRPAAISPNT